MLSAVRRLALAAILLSSVLPVGCNDKLFDVPESALVQKPLERDALDGFYTPMYLNAAAQNTNVAEGHFYPRSADLNSLGTQQLGRIAKSLEQRGGTVRYETRSTDDAFVNARIGSIETYLTDIGLDMSTVDVKGMMPGGRGLSGRNAQIARAKSQVAADTASVRNQADTEAVGGP